LPALGCVEAAADRVVMLAPDRGDLAEHGLACLGEVQRVQASVLPVAAPLDEPAVGEGVHQAHEPARRHAQLLCHGLLALSG
jgi:hypothetical protein